MSLSTESIPTMRTASTSAPIVTELAERWSPRSFDPEATVSDAQLTALLEAARWAPSASNHQPRRFVVATRGTHEFDILVDALIGFNAAWAHNASALIVGIAETSTVEGDKRPYAAYDLGQAIAHLSVQAHAEGLHTHQMAGVQWDKIVAAFDLTENLEPLVVTAVGTVAAAELLPEALAERETAERTRLSLDELVLSRS
ncbi:nitroreductase [Arthrobacter sp. RIT-PI-e]|uniref:nitroreductase family protein n=1 Tax=Arthrobacter sp. RIT-PI-e TaxID=1681197 RepID=UPI0006761351|nr:nitroreductase family protein [Arthrobacter sp. RIT-PI-e]KNC19396.1 nitroreductase [Arthrobacter sp. RIT-PI-e]